MGIKYRENTKSCLVNIGYACVMILHLGLLYFSLEIFTIILLFSLRILALLFSLRILLRYPKRKTCPLRHRGLRGWSQQNRVNHQSVFVNITTSHYYNEVAIICITNRRPHPKKELAIYKHNNISFMFYHRCTSAVLH